MFKKTVFTIIGILVAGLAFASVNVYKDGQNYGPAQDINFTGGTVSGQNDPVKTIDLTTFTNQVDITGGLTTDGTIYTAKIVSDGAIYLGHATVDPCATLGAGYIFINNTTGAPCFCNNFLVDLSLYDGTTACF